MSPSLQVQLNNLFETVQTPRPTQPLHDPRYHYLLNSPPRSFTPYSTNSASSSSSSSSLPSPSSTLYSASSLALRDDSVRKVFIHDPSLPDEYAQLALSSPPGTPNKAGYELWMLSPDVASYAHFFPPIQRDYNLPTPSSETRDPSFVRPPQPTPPPQGPPSKRVSSKKPWSQFFQSGCCTRERDPSVEYARRIVASQKWDQDRMLDLARAFIWRSSDPDAPARDVLPVFAARVRDAFEGRAQWFAETLRGALVGTFISCWHVDKDNRKAIVYDITRQHYSSFVVSALCLSSFIGELYTERIVRRSDVIGCIRVLFHNLALVEHLTAISNILRRAGTRLWKEAVLDGDEDGVDDDTRVSLGEDKPTDTPNPTPSPPRSPYSALDLEVESFKSQLLAASKTVQDHRFVITTRAPVKGTVKGKVEGLIRYVEECRRFVKGEGEGKTHANRAAIQVGCDSGDASSLICDGKRGRGRGSGNGKRAIRP